VLAVLVIAGAAWFLTQGGGSQALTDTQRSDPAFIGPDLHSVVADPLNPLRVFAGGHSSAVVSNDGGKTVRQVDGLKGVDAMSWVQSPDGLSQLVAGHYGVHVSTDGGKSWTDLTPQLPGSDVHAAGMDPSQPPHIWAYVVGRGVYASTDGGKGWSLAGGTELSLMGPVLVQPGGTEMIATDMQQGVVRSSDSGKTWSELAGLMAYWLTSDPGDARHLLAVGQGLSESVDAGASWKELARAPSGIRAVAIGAGTGAPWYAGRMLNQHAVLYRSTDHGGHWEIVSSAL
jgi:hypothetical protein